LLRNVKKHLQRKIGVGYPYSKVYRLGVFSELSIKWYNTVLSPSPDTKRYLQTPEYAFWNRLPVNANADMAAKICGWCE